MRKLAAFALSFSAAIFLSHYILPRGILPLTAAVLCGCALAGFAFRGNVRKRILLVCLGAAAGMAWYVAYTNTVCVPAENMCGKNIGLSAVVNDFPENTKNGQSAELLVDAKDGTGIKAVMYVYDDSIRSVKPGDRIRLTADVSDAGVVKGESTDTYFAKGIFLVIRNVDKLEVTEQKGFSLKYLHKYTAKAIKDKIIEIFPEKTEGFILALITGDRSIIDEDTELNVAMSRTGVYHIIAVSGMHVAVLADFISNIFGRKRRTALITVAVLILFAGITGFSPSVVRAVVMQIFLLAASVFERENDSVTSLSTALMLLLCVNPYAAASAGLQLSFAAVAGMIFVSEKLLGYIYNKLNRLFRGNRRLRTLSLSVAGSVSATLGAQLFTLPLCAVYFGYVSLAAPIVNLVILWAVSPAFCAGAIAVGLGYILAPLGKVAVLISSLLLTYISEVVELFSDSFFASVYLNDFAVICWFVYIYLAIVLFVAMKAKPREALLPVCMGLLSICVILLVTAIKQDLSDMEVTVVDVGQGQSIVITNGEYTAVVDCGSSSEGDAGKRTAEYLYGIGRQKVDVLVLTHYHADHVNGLEELMAYADVSVILAPVDDGSENSLHDSIAELAKAHNSDIIYVTEKTTVSLEDASLILYEPLGVGNENESGICVLAEHNGFEALVTGDIDSMLERQLVSANTLPNIECLIAGHHGSGYSTSVELLDAVKPETAIISVGYNTYGHPTDEVLARLEERNISVHRTDRDGTITVSADKTG